MLVVEGRDSGHELLVELVVLIVRVDLGHPGIIFVCKI